MATGERGSIREEGRRRHSAEWRQVGEAADTIASSLCGQIALDKCGTLDVAIERGLAEAASGDVLLLAPACTSFDQYADFEERGRHFRILIAAHAATD